MKLTNLKLFKCLSNAFKKIWFIYFLLFLHLTCFDPILYVVVCAQLTHKLLKIYGGERRENFIVKNRGSNVYNRVYARGGGLKLNSFMQLFYPPIITPNTEACLSIWNALCSHRFSLLIKQSQFKRQGWLWSVATP